MNSFSVCAIVLNWNGTRDTLECLNSLSCLKDPLQTIILVDNASDDDPAAVVLKWAKSLYPSESVVFLERPVTFAYPSTNPAFVLIKNKMNAGYSGGNNIGIQYALFVGAYDFIWILNNDTVVAEDSLSHLVTCMQLNPAAGIAGSTVVYHADPEKVQCAGGCRYNPWTTINNSLFLDQPVENVLKKNKIVKMDYVYGASMFVRASLFEKCGLFNDDYFLFYEEMDFCKRATKAGYQLTWCQRSIVKHKGSQSVGQPFFMDCGRAAFVNYHENLSTLIFTKTFYPFLLPVSMFFRFFGKIAILLKRRHGHLITPLMHAYMDFLRGKNKRAAYVNEK